MIREKLHSFRPQSLRVAILAGLICLLCGAALVVGVQILRGQQQKIVWSPQQEAIVKQIQGLRQLPEKRRARVTKQLAIEIRQMPADAGFGEQGAVGDGLGDAFNRRRPGRQGNRSGRGDDPRWGTK